MPSPRLSAGPDSNAKLLSFAFLQWPTGHLRRFRKWGKVETLRKLTQQPAARGPRPPSARLGSALAASAPLERRGDLKTNHGKWRNSKHKGGPRLSDRRELSRKVSSILEPGAKTQGQSQNALSRTCSGRRRPLNRRTRCDPPVAAWSQHLPDTGRRGPMRQTSPLDLVRGSFQNLTGNLGGSAEEGKTRAGRAVRGGLQAVALVGRGHQLAAPP